MQTYWDIFTYADLLYIHIHILRYAHIEGASKDRGKMEMKANIFKYDFYFCT